MQRNFVLKVALVLLCTVAVLERWQDRNKEGLLGKPRNPGISSKPRKSRKRFFTANENVKRNMMRGPLSKELRKKFGTRNVVVRVGDFVKVLKGDHKGKVGRVTRCVTSKLKVAVSGITHKTATGKTVPVLIYANKLRVEALGPRRKQFEQFYTAKDEQAFAEFEATSRVGAPLPKSGRRDVKPKEAHAEPDPEEDIAMSQDDLVQEIDGEAGGGHVDKAIHDVEVESDGKEGGEGGLGEEDAVMDEREENNGDGDDDDDDDNDANEDGDANINDGGGGEEDYDAEIAT